ncbi:copper resistance protein CopC [Micromonospora sp. 4G57]|uniref:Copper resistance protein CopC n=1 Tax=Micromonospora sicca TaxID=2202420 RepID=A0ABU5JIL2_9ACTN|nr:MULTISPECIES: copper resistance protein CopC [unclassified Micromonospora]MDZ5445839.1 copper resistance protein CopC [Micromonospora sp. 4G57]MDZ5492450.1 copper resistance protein CopC [Micromonospora sp. 4G53]
MGGSVARVARTRLAVLGVAVGVSVALPATPAAAHNSLTGSDPRNGARLAAAPKRIELRFLATPAPGTTKITVTGPGNAPATGGVPTFRGNRVSVPFKAGAAGLYIVDYRVGSVDGHPVTGEIRFSLTTGTPAAPPSATAPPSAAPSAGAGATGPTTSPTAPASGSPVSPAPTGESSDERGAGWFWLLAAVVVLLLLGGGLLLRRRTTRR